MVSAGKIDQKKVFGWLVLLTLVNDDLLIRLRDENSRRRRGQHNPLDRGLLRRRFERVDSQIDGGGDDGVGVGIHADVGGLLSQKKTISRSEIYI